MLGPIATTTSTGRDPNSRPSASSAAGAAPAAVPRQPAWTAATAPVFGSAMSSGTQSAALTAIATSGSSDTSASAACRFAAGGIRRRTTTTSRPWTWFTVTVFAASSSAAARRQSSAEYKGSARVVKRCGAIESSGRHFRTVPATVLIQQKDSGTVGRVMYDGWWLGVGSWELVVIEHY